MRVEPDHLLDLLLDALRLGGRQIDLVKHGHDLVVGIERVIYVGERLRLDALARIDDEERPFTGRERARHLVGEIDVTGRVHQVEDVGLPILRRIGEPHGLRLDGDAALALDIHVVEDLLDHLARRQTAGRLDQTVGKRRFAMVDMGDDREIADQLEGMRCHEGHVATRRRRGKRALRLETRRRAQRPPVTLCPARCAATPRSSVRASGCSVPPARREVPGSGAFRKARRSKGAS